MTSIWWRLAGSRTCHGYEDNCDCGACLRRSWDELKAGLRRDLAALLRRVKP